MLGADLEGGARVVEMCEFGVDVVPSPSILSKFRILQVFWYSGMGWDLCYSGFGGRRAGDRSNRFGRLKDVFSVYRRVG